MVCQACPVDPTNGRARLVIHGPDIAGYSVSGAPLTITVGGPNSFSNMTPGGTNPSTNPTDDVVVGSFIEIAPVASGVSTITLSAYEAGVLQSGTVTVSVSAGTVGAWGAGAWGAGAWGVGSGAGGGRMSAAWASGTIPVT